MPYAKLTDFSWPMPPRPFYAHLKFVWFAILLGLPGFLVAASSDSAALLNLVDVPQQQIAELNQGQIISHDIPEVSGKELATSIAVYLPAPLPKVITYLQNSNLLEVDPDIIAHGKIGKNPTIADFDGIIYSKTQIAEITDLLNAEPGDRFNLSSQEIDNFNTLKTALAGADDKILIEAVSQKYRELLLQRCLAYRTGGLAAIETYARDGASADPAAELRSAAENNQVLVQLFPELFRGWLNYPHELPNDPEEHFYWINRRVEDRPTVILEHRIQHINQSGALIVARQYYVGHSYNSSQLIAGALPYRNGVLLFYGQRTSTDQVTGIASGLRHNIGREQMKTQMIIRLQNLSHKLMMPVSHQ